jgi:hypothetical protein
LLIAAVVASVRRFKDTDFSSPWLAGPYDILIPIPNYSANTGALIKPMDTEVSTQSSAAQLIKQFHSYINESKMLKC